MSESHHIFPAWGGPLLMNPLRKKKLNPAGFLSPYIETGDRILDFGCGMGFLTLPAADLCGKNGNVTAVDIQAKMLKGLRKRAARKNLDSRVGTIQVDSELAELENQRIGFDLILAFFVVHEVPDQDKLFRIFSKALKPGGKLLFAEPAHHVSELNFQASLRTAELNGLVQKENLSIPNSQAVILEKPVL